MERLFLMEKENLFKFLPLKSRKIWYFSLSNFESFFPSHLSFFPPHQKLQKLPIGDGVDPVAKGINLNFEKKHMFVKKRFSESFGPKNSINS